MSRRQDLDIARVVAVVGVIAVHVSAGTVLRGADAVGREGFAVALGFDAFGRVAVPVFFALAGWVLLFGKPVTSRADLRRRVVRVLIPLACWSAVYALWLLVWSADASVDGVWKTLVRSVAGVPAAPHLWYLYVYVPLVLLLGAVWLAFRRVPAWGAVVAVSAVAAFPVALQMLSEYTGRQAGATQWGVPLFALSFAVGGGVVLGLLGASTRRRAFGLVVFTVCTGVMVAAAWMTGHARVFAYAGPFVAVQCAAALVAVNGATVKGRLSGAVASLAGVSFGVYLVHMLVLQALLKLLVPIGPAIGGVKAWWSIPVLTLLTLLLSWALAVGWQKARLSRFLG